MGLTSDSFLRSLQGLLPRGRAWTREPGADLTLFLQAIADEFCRIDARATDLIRELDPRQASELLEDYERLLALPDECTGEATSITQRRNEIILKLTSQGAINRQFYIDLALNLGYTITIYEYREFRAGLSVAGDPVSNGDWVHVWRVNAPAAVGQFFSAGQNVAGDPLAVYSDGVLECVINKRKPAETIVLFAYGA